MVVGLGLALLGAPQPGVAQAATRVGASVTILPPPLRVERAVLRSDGLGGTSPARLRFVGPGAVPALVEVGDSPEAGDSPRPRVRIVRVAPIA